MFWLSLIALVTCSEQQEIDDRLMNEVKTSWQEFNDLYYENARGVVKCSALGKGVPDMHQVVKFQSQSRRFRLITDSMNPDNPRQLSAMVFNEYYGFLLDKPQKKQ